MRMETECTYFTRRALQERTKAAGAASAKAATVHLELAFRLVRVSTDPPLSPVPDPLSGGGRVDDNPAAARLTVWGNALAGAFPLRPSGSFEQLLEALDTADRG